MPETPDDAIAQDIARHGHSLIVISDIHPPFVYTAGLMFTWQHPELILFGQRQNGPAILSDIVDLIRAGQRFDKAAEYDGVLDGYRIAIRPVHPTQHEFYLGYAMGYCTAQGRIGQLQAVEVFWPDRQGRFPFQPGCTEAVWAAQPRLDQPLGPREIRERQAAIGDP